MESRALPLDGFRFVNNSIYSVEICLDGIWLKNTTTVTMNKNEHLIFAPINPRDPGAEKFLNDTVAVPVETIKTLYSIQNSRKENYSDLVNEGILLASEGYYEQAKEKFMTAINLDPSREEAYANLANTYDDAGDCQEAISIYEKCIEINPTNQNTYFNLAAIYSTMSSNSARNMLTLEQPWGSFSDEIENANAYMLMAAYLGDEEAKRVLQTIEIVYKTEKGTHRRKPNINTPKEILADIINIAEYKLAWGSYNEAKKYFSFVLTFDKNNADAITGIDECNNEIDS